MQILRSKKFWVTLLGALGVVTAGTQDQPWYVVLGLSIGAAAYVVGQGLADQGKEATKLTIEAAGRGGSLVRGEMLELRTERETDPAPPETK